MNNRFIVGFSALGLIAIFGLVEVGWRAEQAAWAEAVRVEPARAEALEALRIEAARVEAVRVETVARERAEREEAAREAAARVHAEEAKMSPERRAARQALADRAEKLAACLATFGLWC
jgi:hypothetical protein